MQKIIEQLYDGESFLNEHLNVKIAGYKEAKNIAFEAHEVFESKLSQAMKIELDEFLSKQADVTNSNTSPLFCLYLHRQPSECRTYRKRLYLARGSFAEPCQRRGRALLWLTAPVPFQIWRDLS